MKKLFWFLACFSALVMMSCGGEECAEEKTEEIEIVGMWDVCEIGSLVMTEDCCQNTPSDLPWIEFREEGTFGASVGCNGIGGIYKFEDNTLTFKQVGRTEMYCDDMMATEDSLCSNLMMGDDMKVKLLKDSVIDITSELSGKHLVLRKSSRVIGID